MISRILIYNSGGGIGDAIQILPLINSLKVEFKDYYFSNVVARASKTMFECNNSKLVLKKTGTEVPN